MFLSLLTAQAEIKYMSQQNELEIGKSKELVTIEVKKVVQRRHIVSCS